MNIISKILLKLLTILMLVTSLHASNIHLAPSASLANINENATETLVNSLKPVLNLITKDDIIYFIGSGDGKHIEKTLEHIKEKSNTVYIIDISVEMLNKCKQNLSKKRNLSSFDIFYIKGDAHDIQMISKVLPNPNVIFALDVLTNIKIPVDAVESLLSVLNKVRGVFCAYYPASIGIQPKVFHKYASLIFKTESDFHIKYPEAALARAKENRYYNPNPIYMKNKFSSEYHLFRRRILIKQTLYQLITMITEEEDYIKKFFGFTKDSYAMKLFYYFIKQLKNSSHLISEKSTPTQTNPFNIVLPRYWNVITIVPKTLEINPLIQKHMPRTLNFSA